MQTIVQTTLLSMCLALAMSAAPLSRSARNELSLGQLLMRTTAASEGNPTRSLECFGIYMPVLDDILVNYEATYTKCLDTADEDRDKLDNLMMEEKRSLICAGEQSCDLFKNCTLLKTSLDLFDCYARTGSENVRTMYAISADASKSYDILLEYYRQVDVQEDRCTSAAEREYVEDTAKTYDDLQACLNGESPLVVPLTIST